MEAAKTCFFIGHRDAPEEVLPQLEAAVETHVAAYGVTDFVVGGYGRFDALAARAVLAGVPLWELPPDSLEELAGRLGNQEMAALLERRGPAAEETAFRLPPEELETAPFPVPEEPAQLVQPPAGLTAGEGRTAAFDPVGLLE